MAIVTPNNMIARDTRFKAWAKKVSAETVNLSREGAFALTGEFVGYDKSVALEEGEFLIVASEQGSTKHHAYRYVLVNAEGQKLNEATREPVLAWARTQGLLTQQHEAKMQNSIPYTYAVYVAMLAAMDEADGHEADDVPPEGITSAEWAQTPASVKAFIRRLMEGN